MLSVLIVLIICVYHCIKKMPFETINQKVALSHNLFAQKGAFSVHAEKVLRSMVTKDTSSVKLAVNVRFGDVSQTRLLRNIQLHQVM